MTYLEALELLSTTGWRSVCHDRPPLPKRTRRRVMKHLTWRGRLSWIYYRVREAFVVPAPPEQRCFMGAPIGPDVQCPRYCADDFSIWCKHHTPKLRRLSRDD